MDTLPRWLAGEITPQKQGEQGVTYSRLLRKEDGRISWAEPAELIARKCRAFYPWPTAFTFWGERELKILRARPLPTQQPQETPGRVVQADSEIAVVTGSGLLLLDEVQLAGKRPLRIQEFVRGQRNFVGSLLH
ncbi:MAG: hypothetical protein H5T63_07060 [Chloroflexi bacterium]|nr:hypothetical protein [Chloroflexota bacterium]